MTEIDSHDRRVRKTQLAIFNAFRELVLSRRYDEIRVADIIDVADVGRSTFYDHFNSKDDILLRSIEGPFSILAEMVSGEASRERVVFILEHFWEQRALARILFNMDHYFKLARKLRDMIEPKIATDKDAGLSRRARAMECAAMQLGLIRGWVIGEFASDAEILADHLQARSLAMQTI